MNKVRIASAQLKKNKFIQMKNQFNITLALIIALTSLQGCKKDNNSNNPTGQEILTMTVDGVNWVGDDNLAGYIQTTNNKAYIGGRKSATDETLIISNIPVTGLGTYPIIPTPGQGITFLRDGVSPKQYKVSASYPKSRASFTITKLNGGSTLNNIEGTFSGALYNSATDSVVITNGIFKFN